MIKISSKLKVTKNVTSQQGRGCFSNVTTWDIEGNKDRKNTKCMQGSSGFFSQFPVFANLGIVIFLFVKKINNIK